METTRAHKLFVGIDVAATTLAVAWLVPGQPLSQPFTVAQTPQGYATLLKRLRALGAEPAETLVVMEATGSYWIALATTLVEAGFQVSVINPAQAHHFAKALLKRGKTDAIDAQTLEQLGAHLQPAIWSPPPAIYQELQQRLAERDVLVNLRQHVRNQLHALQQPPIVIEAVRSRMGDLIRTFNRQIAAIERELTTALQHDEAWAAAAARLQTIPGVGLITTGWLLVATLNFSLCDSPEAAAA